MNRLGDRLADLSASYGTLLIFALLPFMIDFRLGTPGAGQVYFLKIGTFSVFALFLLGRVLGRIERPRIDVPVIAIALSSVFIALSALLSKAPEYSFNAALQWFAAFALFFMLRTSYRRWNLFSVFSWLLMLQALPLAIYGIAQEHGFEFLPYSGNVLKNNVISTFGHPNFFSSYMGPVLFLCLARVLSPGLLVGRLLGAVTALVIAYALYLAEGRAVWIGSALGLGAVGLCILGPHWRSFPSLVKRRDVQLLIGAAAVVVFSAVIYAGSAAVTRFPQRAISSLLGRSQWENRLYFWYTASRMHHPLSPIGLGMTGFGEAFWTEVDIHQQSEEGKLFIRNLIALTYEGRSLDPRNAHNDYIELWAESGPIALFGHLLLVGYLIFFFLSPMLSPRASPPIPLRSRMFRGLLLGGYVCMLFDSALGFPLYLPCSLALFWLMSAVLNQYIDFPQR